MSNDVRLRHLRAAAASYKAGRISRRQFAGILGALGISAASLSLFRGGRSTAASGDGAHGGHGLLAQEGGAPATPVVGVNADGTRTWKVRAGAMLMEGAMAEISAFLPGTITINAGDTIYFPIEGFHNVAFTSGAEIPPLFIPADPAMPPVATPPASAAGQPQLLFNPEVLFPSQSMTYDGTGVLNSGLPLDPAAPPVAITFTTPGEYDYACWIHQPYMVGKVIVQEAGSPLPMEQDGVDAQAEAELAAFVETARALLAAEATPAAGGAEVLIGPGQENVELLTYLPQEVRIKAGETVRWTHAGSMSPHTVTFLGGGEPIADIVPIGGTDGPPAFAINPNSFYASDNVGQPYGGEGIVNSGYMGPFPGMPTTFELTFEAPGEYKYYCILHAGGPEDPPAESMTAKVIVE